MNYQPADEFVYDEPERTSILAILSLIASLICFIPLIGVVGIFLGIFALVGIGSSKGRVKGTGLAVAGIVIGLIFSTIWIGVGFAGQQVVSEFPKLASVMVEVEGASNDEVRKALAPNVHPMATDEAIAQFRDAYQAELGAFNGAPEGLISIMQAYGEIGPVMNRINDPATPYQGQMIPVPGDFDNGRAVILLAFDPASQQSQGGTSSLLYSNIGIMTPGGSMFWLYDPAMQIGLPAGDSEGDADMPAEGDGTGESMEEDGAPAENDQPGEGG